MQSLQKCSFSKFSKYRRRIHIENIQSKWLFIPWKTLTRFMPYILIDHAKLAKVLIYKVSQAYTNQMAIHSLNTNHQIHALYSYSLTLGMLFSGLWLGFMVWVRVVVRVGVRVRVRVVARVRNKVLESLMLPLIFFMGTLTLLILKFTGDPRIRKGHILSFKIN